MRAFRRDAIVQCDWRARSRVVAILFDKRSSHFRSFAARKRDVFAKKCIDHELVGRASLRGFGRQVARTSRNVRIGRQSMRNDALT